MKIYQLGSLLLCLGAFACNQPAASPTSVVSTNHVDSLQRKKGTRPATPLIVFRSVDGGQTWQDISEGLPKPVVDSYGVYKNVSFANDHGLYLNDGNGLYHSNPTATAPFWTKETIPDKQSRITPGKNGLIAFNLQGGILQKSNGTGKWSPVYTNFRQKNIRSVFESSASSIFIGTDGGLFKSANNGKTWKAVHPDGWTMKIVEVNGVLMGTNTNGIIRSADDGEHWSWVVNEYRRGFAVESIQNGFAIIYNKTRKDTGSVRTTYDGGKTWEAVDGSLPDGYNIASFIQFGDNLFCGHPNGIFRSTDKGKTWKLLLPTVKDRIFNLTVSGNVIYAIPSSGC